MKLKTRDETVPRGGEGPQSEAPRSERRRSERLQSERLQSEAPPVFSLTSGYSLGRPMKKIRCPHCAVINLEKFVTYPHCAGCGALLTEETPAPPRWAAWKRPLGPILWATIIGFAALAAVGALTLVDERPTSVGQLAVYGQTQRRMQVGREVTLSLELDTIDANRSTTLSDVELRLDGDLQRNFQIVAFKPQPQGQSRLGGGIYYRFGKLSDSLEINVTLRARLPGKHKVRATVFAKSLTPGEYQATISVAPDTAAGRKTVGHKTVQRKTDS